MKPPEFESAYGFLGAALGAYVAGRVNIRKLKNLITSELEPVWRQLKQLRRLYDPANGTRGNAFPELGAEPDTNP